MFSSFLSNNESEVSNTVEYWERIPKYFFTPGKIKKLRNADGLAQPFEWEYTIQDLEGIILPYKVVIQPALIKQPNKSYKAFFPSITEELIEEALKKIFSDQDYGIHNSEKTESWVRFSYNMIKRELESRGKSRTYTEIKRALEVMSKCIITVYENGETVYTGAILSDYISVNREKYLGDTNTHHIARLPVFISHSINSLHYRQYNYARLMDCKEQLTRWIYHRLINRFTYASHMNDYHFMYSDVKQGSGLLQQTREVDNRQKLLSCLNELKERGVIQNYTAESHKNGRKIIDVKYIVKASSHFISEQKAANKRHTNSLLKAKNSSHPAVDN